MNTNNLEKTSWQDIIFGAIQESLRVLFTIVPLEYRFWLGLILICLSALALIIIIYPIVHKGIDFFRDYTAQRHRNSIYRFEYPGSFSWGNKFLRAPLHIIGTDIYCFAQLSVRSKILRYIKSGSVIIPVLWCILGMSIFVATSRSDSNALDLYISVVPILLIASTILLLDLTIITSNRGLGLKIFRGCAAIVAGYVFSSIPLNYYFGSAIDSHIAEHDSQKTSISTKYDKSLAEIQAETWYATLTTLEKSVTNLTQRLADEREGKGTGKGPNKATGNIIYEQIEKEIIAAQANLANFKKTHQVDIERRESLIRQKNADVGTVEKSNTTNHIKRHIVLWQYAFSSVGVFLYFFAIMCIFWLVDLLSVFASFIHEDEYENLVAEFNSDLKEHFKRENYKKLFLPGISAGQIV